MPIFQAQFFVNDVLTDENDDILDDNEGNLLII